MESKGPGIPEGREAQRPGPGGMALDVVIFRVGGQAHALPLEAVRRAVRAAGVTPLPGAPHPVVGVLDVAGRVLPVLSLRRRLGLAAETIAPDMHFLIARMGNRDVVLPVDEVTGVARIERPTSAADILRRGLERFAGVVRMEDGLVLIDDLEAFFSPDEWRRLDEAIARGPR